VLPGAASCSLYLSHTFVTSIVAKTFGGAARLSDRYFWG
jgi:hypothetical protein